MAETATAPPAPPCTLVIFGATGDLTRRLLMPALRNLRRDGLLPDDFALVGVASRDIGDDGFRDHLRKGMEQFKGGDGPADIDWFLQRSRYLAGKFEAPETYQALAGLLPMRAAMRCSISPRRPSKFAVIAGQLGKAGLLRESDERLAAPHHREAVRPRPAVGGGAQQARSCGVARENQVFRIDHYLGKETVQNILVLPLRQRLRSSRCGTATTSTTCRSRSPRRSASSSAASPTTRTGALRDMVPNHLFQLLTLIAMEPPSHLRRRRAARREGQGAATPSTASTRGRHRNVVRGQYGAGAIDGKTVAAYRQEPDVPPDSTHRDLRRA